MIQLLKKIRTQLIACVFMHAQAAVSNTHVHVHSPTFKSPIFKLYGDWTDIILYIICMTMIMCTVI